jgi:hypothetical protein
MIPAFVLVVLAFGGVAALLWWQPQRRLLNFVPYDAVSDVEAVNREAARSMLLPLGAGLLVLGAALWRPEWSVPMVILLPLAVLGMVLRVSVAAGRLRVRRPS